MKYKTKTCRLITSMMGNSRAAALKHPSYWIMAATNMVLNHAKSSSPSPSTSTHTHTPGMQGNNSPPSLKLGSSSIAGAKPRLTDSLGRKEGNWARGSHVNKADVCAAAAAASLLC